MMTFNRIIGVIVSLAFLTACGKVTQDTSKPKTIPSVDVSFSVPVSLQKGITIQSVDSAKAKAKDIGTTTFGTKDSPIYIQIQGVKDDSKTDELSYGKGLLVVTTTEKKDNTGKVTKQTVYESTSYNKTGLKLKASNLDESFFAYDSGKKSWSIKSNKIKKGYGTYLAQVYADKNTYRFKVMSQKQVTGNKAVAFGDITDYDTFVGVLFRYISNEKNMSYDTKTQDAISALYGPQFYKYLSFEFPPNSVKKFNTKAPVFVFESNQLGVLIDVLNLIHTDKDEALAYLNKKHVISAMPKQARTHLKQSIEKHY